MIEITTSWATPTTQTTQDMKIGDFAVIVREYTDCDGIVLARLYGGEFYSLDGRHKWGQYVNLPVRILGQGDSLTIKVKRQ